MSPRYAPLAGPAILFAQPTPNKLRPLDFYTQAVALGANGVAARAVLHGSEVHLDAAVVGRRFRKKWRNREGASDNADNADIAGNADIAAIADIGDIAAPSLRQLCELVGQNIELSVELKDETHFGAVVETARAQQPRPRLWVCHSNFEALAVRHLEATEVRLVNSASLAALPRGPERRAAQLREAGIDAVKLRHSEWTAGLVALFHRFEVLAFASDLQFDHQLAAVLNMGVDAVYGEDIAGMLAVTKAQHCPEAKS
ncbi:MAG: hypothetical protein KTU85_07055 [Acidimicrobiia bacterium]|nr:hypothetical protein [Acidimicrobiia bacterium]MCY4458439.1 hypothetical protein [Acidimicrobiaceae bacterium]